MACDLAGKKLEIKDIAVPLTIHMPASGIENTRTSN